MTCTIRNYRSTDVEDLVALINAADSVDKNEEGTSVQEMHEFLGIPEFNPEQNAFVVQEDNGRIIGFAHLRLAKAEEENTFRVWFVVHPMRRGRGLEERILARLFARVEERMDECTTDLVYFATHASSIEPDKIALLERMGLHEMRRYWRMVRPTLDDLPEPRFPEGLVTHAYRIGEDDVRMHAADREAFLDHWGHSDVPLEMWQHYVSQPSFKADLTVIAEDPVKGEIAGFCTIGISEDESKRLGVQRGWIDVLGVRRPYRRSGLGTALILSGLRNLRAAGMQQAALGCDSENLTGATRIYERVGFRVDNTRVAFRKAMRGAPGEPSAVRQNESFVIAS